jgi:hypothetical protein
MGWFVHYWDEIDKRNVCSDATSEKQDAMRKACCLMREGRVVSHVAGPNGERVDIMTFVNGAPRVRATKHERPRRRVPPYRDAPQCHEDAR